MSIINAFVIVSSESIVLVDTGLPNSHKKIGLFLKRQGLSYKDVDLIIVTHAHGDHAGNAKKLQELCQAPVLAHAVDLPYYLREKPMVYCPTGLFGKLLLKTGRPQTPYASFTPDILLQNDDRFALTEFGLDGTVFHTPGHTQGSLSVILSNRKVLAGDLVSSGILLGGIVRKDKAMQPPFEEDTERVAKELLCLLDCGMETFYLGHGGPLSSQEVKRHAETLLRKTV
ncbi:MBL fold metallo-hydrolase [Flexibacterium corallicola]|uniref:MBL fold metallo-hydrolase n=1 Tax=Flexibacterium corallicola TaxID=3037259 RepID=UPI00286F9064|nr:MBL fold metallo-hydrolase [Pseudovibrio sp. M1P-2-3]